MLNNANNELIPFYSAAYTRSFLTCCYEQSAIEQPKTKGFQTCYSFIYHLKHGQLYIEQAHQSPMDIKPMLLFYGLVQFLKTLILTKDPTYPANSQVLSHGVTTRKRKKSGFTFLSDEIKIQKHGLFPHFLCQMFHMKHLDKDKFLMDQLLKQLPNMASLFTTFDYPKYLVKGSYKPHCIEFPSTLLDSYHMTSNRFEQYIQYSTQPWSKKGASIAETNQTLMIPISNKPLQTNSFFPFVHNDKSTPFLFLHRGEHAHLPEILIHYLLLYNLSMICRYETEWWGEVLHTFDGHDLPFITRYIDLASKRIPDLIVQMLTKNQIS
ncbi:YaaC family protein [Bacillus sp. FJAT-45037]|uniref:YaaC family protein n=1 Tax=Bacillus sp. FJAT-45037 TaxID=2011007 RepID=UPI001E353933|nr:YaaC family protein [Bacillus sp. FJAT-45037]